MNKKQYNNVIDWTIKHEEAAKSQDSLEAARAIFKNMGVALPNGSMQEVFETIKTNDYMGWKACTMEEAQQAADKGVAAIGICEDQIVVLTANDEDEPVVRTTPVISLPEDAAYMAEAGFEYFSYSYCSTTTVVPENNNYTNAAFDMRNKDALLADLRLIMDEKQDILSHHTLAECIDIILGYDSTITGFCNIYHVPKQLVQTLLLRELWCVDITDDIADEAVRAYFQWMQDFEEWSNLPTLDKMVIQSPQRPLVMKEDCSTGIGQMFAWVAIDAHNLAIDKNIIYEEKYDKANWHDCSAVWYSLNGNDTFAIKMTTLEMHHCADYAGVTGSMFECSEAQTRAILARYNGTGDSATEYGNICYGYYLVFKKYA